MAAEPKARGAVLDRLFCLKRAFESLESIRTESSITSVTSETDAILRFTPITFRDAKQLPICVEWGSVDVPMTHMCSSELKSGIMAGQGNVSTTLFWTYVTA